jgi:hypothetical protein
MSNMFMIGTALEANMEKLDQAFRKRKGLISTDEEEESLNPTMANAGILINNSVFAAIDSKLVRLY